MLIVIIAGPIASGKSTLARAVAVRLQAVLDVRSAVIDLDLVYEILDPGRGIKDDQRLWSQARRVAGRLTSGLAGDGFCVIAEGDFASDCALGEFENVLPDECAARLVLLECDLQAAIRRTQADVSRGLSRDTSFLSAHYDAFKPGWTGREKLQVDTHASPLDTAADTVVAWLTSRS